MADLVTLGQSSIKVSKQGLGCMSLTAFYGSPVSNEHGLAVLQKAYDLGVRLFDTAQIYQQFGEVVEGTYKYNEELLGAFAKQVGPENITIATKFYPRNEGPPEDGKYLYSKELLFEETEKSLQRLGLKCIDVYYLHRMYPEEVVSIETIMGHLKELVEAGKVKAIGLSEASAETIRKAHKGENFEKNKKLVAEIEALAKSKGATIAQLCIAWVMAQGAIPIPGTTKIAHVESNWGACSIQLSKEDIATLERVAAGVQGLRGNETYLKRGFHGQKK